MSGPEGETDYSYDKMERLTSVSLPTTEEVKYEYDQLGRKSKLIYPDGKYVDYTYDDLDRITSATDWEGQKTVYSYDANGQRIETVLPNGTKVSYSYDANDRLIKLDNIGADGSIISSFEYSYDQAGNIIQEIQNQSGSVYTRTYAYDTADEVTGFTEQTDQELKTYSYTYDQAGNRLTEDITGNDDTKHLTYAYNEGDELTLKSHDGDQDSYDYDKNGNLIRSTTQGNQVTTYDYDSENRLVQITEPQGKIQTFGYDSDGNRLYKTVGVYWQAPAEQSPLPTVPSQGNGNGKGNHGNPGHGNGPEKKHAQSNFFIQELFHMLSAGGHGNGGGNSGGNSGGGNSGGNGGGSSNSGGSHSGGNGNSGGGNSGSHGNSGGNGNGNSGGNGNGNSGNHGNAGSNGNGQDKGIHDNGKDKEKSNDSGKHVGWDKKKLKKEKGNKGKHLGWYKRANQPNNPYNQTLLNNPEAYEVINYINDVSQENPQVLMTSDQTGTYRGVYTYGLERIAERDLVSVEGVPNDPLYYLYDGHKSVTQMINPAGHVRDKYRYDPFGTPMPGGKLSPNTTHFNNPYGYNGETHDLDSGLQYLRARYYDPSMGRFLSRDSYLGNIMKPLSLNRYTYTMNNPVKYSDPSGHDPFGSDPYISYTVQDGDTLWDLSQNYGTTWQEIARLSGIPEDQAGSILPGQELTIPNSNFVGSTRASGSNSSQGSDDYVNNKVAERQDSNHGDCQGAGGTYTVKSGDSLWKIAQDYGTTVEAIANASGISDPYNTVIYPGQILLFAGKNEGGVDRIAKKRGLNRDDFGDFVEDSKHGIGRAGNDNYTDDELNELADQYLDGGGSTNNTDVRRQRQNARNRKADPGYYITPEYSYKQIGYPVGYHVDDGGNIYDNSGTVIGYYDYGTNTSHTNNMFMFIMPPMMPANPGINFNPLRFPVPVSP